MKLKDITHYEDEHVCGFNKPSGLMVHGDGKNTETTLADMIVKEHPELSEIGEPYRFMDAGVEKIIPRPGIVHRLDRETSGGMVVAKTQKSFSYLKRQFHDRQAEKHYTTIVWGVFPEKSGMINAPIARSKADFRKYQAGRGKRGVERDALTLYRVLGVIKNEEGTFSFLDVVIKTGRTHQIRVHMKYKNHPVLGDTFYSPEHPYALGFNRLALHARSLKFNTPDKKDLLFEAPLPKEFESAKALVL
mgnify:FL=1